MSLWELPGEEKEETVLGGGYRGNYSATCRFLKVLHHATGPNPAANTMQLGQTFPRERLPGVGKKGKLKKTGMCMGDKDQFTGGWEGEKKAGKEDRLWEFSGKGMKK